MMTYSITPSLLGSWEWYLNADGDWEESAEDDFLASLRREKSPPNKAMQDGIDFENRVEAVCKGVPVSFLEGEDYERCVREVASMVAGGTWQVSTAKTITVNGVTFWLHGRMDVLRGPWIYDLKFSKSFDMGKYREAPQTLSYLACEPGPVGIRYIVCDGLRVYVDEFRRDAVKPIEGLLIDFWTWMQNHKTFFEAYCENWSIV
jgi:hypothetical protein